jgi:parvulin-like peptidyl-prolyl isomerase
MLAPSLKQQNQQQVQRDFGSEFAKAVFSESGTEWAGPIHSAHGLHLVRIQQRRAEKVQAYEQIRDRVLADANNAALEKARSDAYARLLTRYTVVMPEQAQAKAQP